MILFDSHAHLADERIYPDVVQVLERAQNAGVQKIVNICTDLGSLERGLALAEGRSNVYLAGAIPPHSVTEENEQVFQKFAEQAEKGRFVAVGETGLDYYYHTSSKELQKRIFIQYLQLALKCHLPVVIHCREAFDDFFEIIDKEYSPKNLLSPGVLHCFTGTQKDAQRLIERGWMISFSGIVTFKKSLELQEIAKNIPLEHLLIETDAPYLAPQSKRGKQNEPAYLFETAQFLADLRGMTLDAFAIVTYDNAQKFFQLT